MKFRKWILRNRYKYLDKEYHANSDDLAIGTIIWEPWNWAESPNFIVCYGYLDAYYLPELALKIKNKYGNAPLGYVKLPNLPGYLIKVK